MSRDSPTESAGTFADGPSHMEAVLRWRGHERDWYGYAIGYRRAVETLATCIDETAARQDTLVFPIGALCRHAVELALKRVLVLLYDYSESPLFKSTNDLRGLWNAALDPLRLGGLADAATDKKIADQIEPLAALDPSGTAFRYPVSVKGDALLDRERINLAALRDDTLDLLGELEALADAVIHDDTLRQEAMRDAAEAWWQGLDEHERAEYERADDELYEAYLDRHLDVPIE